MLWPKKNSYKECYNEKKFLRFENPPPPHNVSNGLSLKLLASLSNHVTTATRTEARKLESNRFLNPSETSTMQ